MTAFFFSTLLVVCNTLWGFTLETPVFKKLLVEKELCITKDEASAFQELYEDLLRGMQKLSKTQMHEVVELIHADKIRAVPKIQGATCIGFYTKETFASDVLSTKLSCDKIDLKFCGRTYFFYDELGTSMCLSFQEESNNSCHKIIYGPVQDPIVQKNIERLLDFLIAHDENLLALPYRKKMQE